MGIGAFIALLFFGIMVGLLVIDYLIQNVFTKTVNLWLIESVLVVIVLAYFYVGEHMNKNIIVSDSFVGTVALVYGVENSPALPLWALEYDLHVPLNGIIMTSSYRGTDFHRTRVLSENHELLQFLPDSIRRYSSEYGPYEIQCNGRAFIYCKWDINRNGSAGYSVAVDTSINVKIREAIGQ